MELEKTEIPEGLRYSKGHVWVASENGLCVLGWTDYIQQNAGDVNYVELLEPGKQIDRDQEFGTIETSKWVDRLCSPVAGRVVASNSEILQRPELINVSPFREGWLVKLRVDTAVESPALLSPDEYAAYVQTCEER
jgi:glycine cleavage system H protein